MKKQEILQNRSESLNYYLRQIQDTQPLTLEEEQALGRRIAVGDSAAFDKLITANLRFVVKCAIEMDKSLVPMEELILAGNYGLTVAAKHYDPTYPNRFCSYAVHYIRQAIRDSIKDWVSQVSMPDLKKMIHIGQSLDETPDDDKDGWGKGLINLIPAPPQPEETHRHWEETKEHIRNFLSKWYYPNEVDLLMDFAQMTIDGYTMSDLARKHRMPETQMKSFIADLNEKARTHNLSAAYKKAA